MKKAPTSDTDKREDSDTQSYLESGIANESALLSAHQHSIRLNMQIEEKIPAAQPYLGSGDDER
jgi:hypothetical protein